MKRVFVAVAAVLVLGACGGGGGSDTLKGFEASSGGSYSASVRSNFIDACVANGGTRSICSCALEKIEDTYSEAEFRGIEADMMSGADLPEDMLDAVVDCA